MGLDGDSFIEVTAWSWFGALCLTFSDLRPRLRSPFPMLVGTVMRMKHGKFRYVIVEQRSRWGVDVILNGEYEWITRLSPPLGNGKAAVVERVRMRLMGNKVIELDVEGTDRLRRSWRPDDLVRSFMDRWRIRRNETKRVYA